MWDALTTEQPVIINSNTTRLCTPMAHSMRVTTPRRRAGRIPPCPLDPHRNNERGVAMYPAGRYPPGRIFGVPGFCTTRTTGDGWLRTYGLLYARNGLRMYLVSSSQAAPNLYFFVYRRILVSLYLRQTLLQPMSQFSALHVARMVFNIKRIGAVKRRVKFGYPSR